MHNFQIKNFPPFAAPQPSRRRDRPPILRSWAPHFYRQVYAYACQWDHARPHTGTSLV
jgi:hypothetical protein